MIYVDRILKLYCETVGKKRKVLIVNVGQRLYRITLQIYVNITKYKLFSFDL